MKKLIVLSLITFLVYSCSKDSPSIPDPKTAPKISAVPGVFKQKVVIENFTETTCGQCPKANLTLDSLIRYNPDEVYGLTIHVNDVMMDSTLLTTNGRNYYDSLFNPTAVYPAGMLNRHLTSLNDLNPDAWSSSTFVELSHIPSCGVALEAENITNGILHLTVHTGFSEQMFGEYRIHVIVANDEIYSNDVLYDQLNDFSYEGATPDSNLSLFPLNDTIHVYRHKYIMQKVVSNGGVLGDVIPIGSMTPGNDYTAYYDIDLNGINTNNSYIIVYIDKYATTLTGHWIENVQLVRIGDTKDWN